MIDALIVFGALVISYFIGLGVVYVVIYFARRQGEDFFRDEGDSP